MSDTASTPLPPEPGVRDLLIEDEMKESYLRYAMSVIVSRALPDARDGLKPSQRRILVAMNDLGLRPNSRHRKCAKICGDTSGNYHPHGEQVVYPTLVRMAQDFNLRLPLVDPQGNFGTPDDPPAAMRYTEARLARACMEMLTDLDEDTVSFVPNYDGTTTEPTVLPARLPNLLINGSQGIAVGMASSIPPHNPGEIFRAVIALLDNPAITVDELMEIVPGPDFPTGAQICGRTPVREAYENGRARLRLRAPCEVEELKGDRLSLVFTALPYGVSSRVITEQIVALVNAKKLTSISDVRDESSLDVGTRLVVDLKRGENDKVVLNFLFKHTRLQETFSTIMIALVNGRPETLSLKRLLEEYRDHRVIVIRRRTRFRLAKAEARAHIVEGLLQALDIIDVIIQTIRSSKSRDEARERLMQADYALPPNWKDATPLVTFSHKQADAILDMRLARLTGLERQKLQDEFTELTERIGEYRAILADVEKVLEIIREDMRTLIETFPTPRRTEITADLTEVRMEDLIADDQVVVTISHEGYVKRLSLDEYRTQTRGGKGVRGAETKEGDFVERIIITTNHQYLLVLTPTGQLYWLRVFDTPEAGRYSRGRALINLLQVDKDDRVETCVPVRTFESGYLLTITKRGKIRKTPLAGFSRPRVNGIIGVRIDEGDRLVGAAEFAEGQEILLTTRLGKTIRFSESDVRSMGRASAGVRGIKLRAGDEVVSLVVIEEGKQILTICENGYGKRTSVDEYPKQRRAGQGVIDIKVTERNGPVVRSRLVDDDDEFMMITEKGQVVRTRVADVRPIGRNTQGVTVMSVPKKDRIVSVALVQPEDEPEDDDSGENAEEGAAETEGGDGEAAPDETANEE